MTGQGLPITSPSSSPVLEGDSARGGWFIRGCVCYACVPPFRCYVMQHWGGLLTSRGEGSWGWCPHYAHRVVELYMEYCGCVWLCFFTSSVQVCIEHHTVSNTHTLLLCLHAGMEFVYLSLCIMWSVYAVQLIPLWSECQMNWIVSTLNNKGLQFQIPKLKWQVQQTERRVNWVRGPMIMKSYIWVSTTSPSLC